MRVITVGMTTKRAGTYKKGRDGKMQGWVAGRKDAPKPAVMVPPGGDDTNIVVSETDYAALAERLELPAQYKERLGELLSESEHDWGEVNVGEGSRTPWGSAQYVTKYGDGIVSVGTAGHGGVKLSPERNRGVPVELRNSNGWYEEDCEAAIALYTYPEEFAKGTRTPQMVKQDAERSVKQWFPDKWEKYSGQKVTAAESSIVAEREFKAAHKDDDVVVSAQTSDTYPGMVEVTTKVGGNLRGDPKTTGEKKYLVPSDEYKPRSNGQSFVVDPARHKKIWDSASLPDRKPAARHKSDLSGAEHTFTDADKNKLAKRWRTNDGHVRSLRDVIERDGITEKRAVKRNGRTQYSVIIKEWDNDSVFTPFSVSKKIFDAVDAPLRND